MYNKCYLANLEVIVKYVGMPLRNFFIFFFFRKRNGDEKLKTTDHIRHTRETRNIMRKIQSMQLSQKRCRRQWVDYDIKILAAKFKIQEILNLRKW